MTLSGARKAGARFLQGEFGESAQAEADYLLCHTLDIDRIALFRDADRELTERELPAYQEVLGLRRRRVPLAYITGQREFFGLTFSVRPCVLIPRPESESLVECALEKFGQETPDVLDLCCGSGCLGIAFASHCAVRNLHFSDIDAEALQVARENAAKLLGPGSTAFLQGNTVLPLQQQYDLILCNPPYVSLDEYANLEPELHYEPVHALIKSDPEAFALHLLLDALPFLKEGGWLLLESTEFLANHLLNRMRDSREALFFPGTDSSGQIRFIQMQKKSSGR
ncbi:MAG: peptide chain release factor N(5)-glutamine methyltransferase [Spirochaetales bacterium]|nr:peptide chain release factor N(5)-glutamine methyltransferase [Spirochaetales bacterium]